MSTESFITSVIYYKFKKSLWRLILYTFLMILYMYIAPGQEQTTPCGQNFDVNRKALSFLKKISLKSDFLGI